MRSNHSEFPNSSSRGHPPSVTRGEAVYPIKYTQSLTRLGGGLHCATWNTLEHGYQNAKYFKPSKRHPFNPFDNDAFTEERLRAERLEIASLF